MKKEMLAMILAGGQGSRLGVFTKRIAKPAVSFGGKYRIIDFVLSNCSNSGIDTVGVLTQYKPQILNSHIGIGDHWDLDRVNGGVTILQPYMNEKEGHWFNGTANAIKKNMDFIDDYDPEYVLILSGDHIYKMDYSKMLEFHKEKGAKATIAVIEVPWDEASRFGIMNTNEDGSIYEFEEKPKEPKSNLASMGIYIFNWKVLREALTALKDQPSCDFGKHIIPYCHERGSKICAYEYKGYWKDVGTLGSYWEANMELVDIIPEFNLYEEFWRIYTKSDQLPPQYIDPEGSVTESIVGEATEVYGTVQHSVIGSGVTIGKGAVIKNSIIMNGAVIGDGVVMDKAIIAEGVHIGDNAELGVGEEVPNELAPHIYSYGLVTIGENSVIPAGVKIGKNVAIFGETTIDEYPDGLLKSGSSIIKAGE